MPSWAIDNTNLSNYIKLNKMDETSKNNEPAQLGIGVVNSRTCIGCSYCEPIIYPKERKKVLKCWGKSNLNTITNINEICDNWKPK